MLLCPFLSGPVLFGHMPLKVLLHFIHDPCDAGLQMRVRRKRISPVKDLRTLYTVSPFCLHQAANSQSAWSKLSALHQQLTAPVPWHIAFSKIQ